MVNLQQRNQQTKIFENSQMRAVPSSQDLTKYLEATSTGGYLKVEKFEEDLYLNKIIQKPWGHEYRVYADNFYDIWKLSILPGCSTSMHCHPRKETALLCLDGSALVSTLDRSYIVSAGDYVYLQKGVFHSTQNIGDTVLELVEVESPRNKFDLVRLQDKYGRAGKRYEQEVMESKVPLLFSISCVNEAKLRKTTSENSYEFCVRGGLDLICRNQNDLLFVASLGLSNAFSQDIKVWQSGDLENASFNESDFYFTIGKKSN